VKVDWVRVFGITGLLILDAAVWFFLVIRPLLRAFF
jgi:hypothetical protein